VHYLVLSKALPLLVSLSFFAPRVAPKFAYVNGFPTGRTLPCSSIDNANSLRLMWGQKKEREFMKEFMLDILRQVFGWNKPRKGNLIFTRYSYNKMGEYGLDVKTIREVFRWESRLRKT
jgi:hypothetical protein